MDLIAGLKNRKGYPLGNTIYDVAIYIVLDISTEAKNIVFHY